MSSLLGLLTFIQNRLFEGNLHFFEQAEQWSPQSKSAHNGLGVAYERLNTSLKKEGADESLQKEALELAAENYQQAIAISPNMTSPMVNLSFVYWKLGRYSECTAILEKVVSLQPNKGVAHANLGFAYESQRTRIRRAHRAEPPPQSLPD